MSKTITIPPCPAWCDGHHDGRLAAGRPRYHERKVGENVAGLGVDLLAEDTVGDDGTVRRAIYLSMFADDGNERMDAAEARGLASLLVAGADRLDGMVSR